MKTVELEEFYENDTRMIRVDLGNNVFTTMEADSWNLIRDLGLTNKLRLHPSGHVITTLKEAPSSYVLIARVIKDCKEHESCKYVDLNSRNLRLSNIIKVFDTRSNLTNSRELVLLSSRQEANVV